MLNLNEEKIFPRLLSDEERKYLFDALPENKPGYKKYRDRIAGLFVIGHGRFGGGNYVLGQKDDKPELSVSSAPVLASAQISNSDKIVSVLIHIEQFDQIEIDIRSEGKESPDSAPGEKTVISLSYWQPGSKYGNFDVREINFSGSEYVLALSAGLKRIWIHERSSGINYPIPVSSYYNELMRLIGDKNPETALNPARIFTNLSEFSDAQLAQAFTNYNKYTRHVDSAALVFEIQEKKSKKKLFFGFLKNR